MTKAYLRFYEELNDYLPEEQRKKRFEYAFEGDLTILDLLERLRVPMSRVDLVLANSDSVDFTHAVGRGEWISFYPVFETLNIRPLLRLRTDPLRNIRFTAGKGLRALAYYLRLCGFDTFDAGDGPLEEAARLSNAENRILLVPQDGELRAGSVSHVWRFQEAKPRLQLLEIIEALDLYDAAAPLTRCPSCNYSFCGAKDAGKGPASGVLASYPPSRCAGCAKHFAAGPHMRRVYRLLEHVLGARGLTS